MNGDLFSGVDSSKVWMSHGDQVLEIPNGWEVSALSSNGIIVSGSGYFNFQKDASNYIKHTGAKLAELLGITPHDISKVTIANTNKVLNRDT